MNAVCLIDEKTVILDNLVMYFYFSQDGQHYFSDYMGAESC